MEVSKTEFIQAMIDFLLVEKHDVSIKDYIDSKYANTCIVASQILHKLQEDLIEHDSLAKEIIRSKVVIDKKLGRNLTITSVWKK